MRILFCEDNKILRENTLFLLKKFFIAWDWAENGQQWLMKIASYVYDVVVLDINMPVADWKEFLTQIRKQWNTTPVIALSSNSMLNDKLEIFDIWADDYMTKPFEIQELVMRIKAVSKRSDRIVEQEITIWDVTINVSQNTVSLRNNIVHLPHKQYLILEYLAKNIWYGKSKSSIMQYVWWEQEENLDFSSTTLESHIYSIRSKLWKKIIQTQKWLWYLIQKNDEI